MKIKQSHYATQIEATRDAEHHKGPGYSARQLARLALLDMREDVDVAKVTLVAQDGESKVIYVLLKDVAKASFLDFTEGTLGPKSVLIEFEGAS